MAWAFSCKGCCCNPRGTAGRCRHSAFCRLYTRSELLFVWLRRYTQIWPNFCVPFGELLFDDVLVLERWYDDDVVAILPVDGRCHAMAVGKLQRVNAAQNLVEIAAC